MPNTLRKAAKKRQPSHLQNTLGGRSPDQHSELQGNGKTLPSSTGHKGRRAASQVYPVNWYTYRVHWSEEDQAYVGTCVEFPSLSNIASSPTRAVSGMQRLVEDVVKELVKEAVKVPVPVASRGYSGAFKVRIPPSVHQRLSLEAAEQGISLNRLISAKLAG
jgi:predicted HicB family RNase H-like nuclease